MQKQLSDEEKKKQLAKWGFNEHEAIELIKLPETISHAVTKTSIRRFEQIIKNIKEINDTINAIDNDDHIALEETSKYIAHYAQFLETEKKYPIYRDGNNRKINNLSNTLKELEILNAGVHFSLGALNKKGIGFYTHERTGKRVYFEAQRNLPNYRLINTLKEKWKDEGLKPSFSDNSEFSQFLSLLTFGNIEQSDSANKNRSRVFKNKTEDEIREEMKKHKQKPKGHK